MIQWNKRTQRLALLGVILVLGTLVCLNIPRSVADSHFVARAERRSFSIEVHTIGVLEAKDSLVVYSAIKGDQGKIIDLVQDGKQVGEGEILVKLDPTPFEEKLAEIEGKIREQKAAITAYENALAMEKNKTQLEMQTARFELKHAEIEHDKIVDGDGPMEQAKLKCALDKAENHYLDLKAFEEDLEQLAANGYLNAGEKKQALKKLDEAKEAYEEAKGQYDNFVQHTYPLQVQKADVGLKKARIKLDEAKTSAHYRIAKAEEALLQHRLGLDYLNSARAEALRELEMTEIKAPAPGMAVLREEFRSGERRKPRVGDLVLKNQPLLNLPNMETVVVKTKVREVDLHKVAVGKPATVAVDAYPNLNLSGEVVSIGVLAVADRHDRSEKVFEVSVQLARSHPRLRPGMTAHVTIHSESVEDRLTVPVPAVFAKKGETFCYRKSLGRFSEAPVELGSHNEHWAVVNEGLSEGDQVALVNPEFWP